MDCSRWEASKAAKTQMWAGKVMASVFWDAHGVLFVDYVEKGKTINSERYIGQSMHLRNEIGEKRLQMKKKKVLFHQDNAPCHKSLATMAKLNELSFELLPHPPYSPDLAPSDYHLFADLEKIVNVNVNVNVKEALDWLGCFWRKLCWWIKSSFAKKMCFS